MLPSMMFRRDVRTGSLTDFIPFSHFSMAPALLVPIASERLCRSLSLARKAKHEKWQRLL
jgi:hypothetical protein